MWSPWCVSFFRYVALPSSARGAVNSGLVVVLMVALSVAVVAEVGSDIGI